MTDETIRLHGLTYIVTECINCGIPFTVPLSVFECQRREGKGCHYCPNGHAQGWQGRGENDKIRQERDRLKQQIAQKDDEIANAKRLWAAAEEKAAYERKKVERLNKRAKAGLCSCCNRHFTNLERHMKSKHHDGATVQ